MPSAKTLFKPVKFEYAVKKNGAFEIFYASFSILVDKDFLVRLHDEFRGKTVLAGMDLSQRTMGSFGGWIAENSKFTSKHASRIAGLLRRINMITKSGGRPPSITFNEISLDKILSGNQTSAK